ncbi:MAG TPA: barstar family protein [Elusimicrobiales bacterium]|nr:barstar family protein [Elusimicrobiales bacterium]
MILVKDKKDFLKSFENPLVFEIKPDKLDKKSLIISISKAMGFPGYVSNWDGLIDMMRGFHSIDYKDIVILIYTEDKNLKVIKDFDECVNFANEFLKEYSKKITLGIIDHKV